MSKDDDSYNGWANHATWNVALWIDNDAGLYDLAKACKRAVSPYKAFRTDLRDVWGAESIGIETPDGVAWNDSDLDIDALDKMISEL